MPPPKISKPASPKNWPAILPYLTKSVLSPSLSPEAHHFLKSPDPNLPVIPHSQPSGPCPLVKITPITDASHPANGQSGLFATRILVPGTFILQYHGVIHSPPQAEVSKGDDAHAASDYDLSLDRLLGIGIDAAVSGSEARFINDYRGVADRANAEFREVWDSKSGVRGMGVFVVGVGKVSKGKVGRFKGITKGEEICVSYGRGFWGARRTDPTSEDAGTSI